ncbi:hypothetical protein ERJ75_001711500 [Trypanosoma vivax]|nr:hypothetical protein ERJ75_001711500 [Trypanosoma vivax]
MGMDNVEKPNTEAPEVGKARERTGTNQLRWEAPGSEAVKWSGTFEAGTSRKECNGEEAGGKAPDDETQAVWPRHERGKQVAGERKDRILGRRTQQAIYKNQLCFGRTLTAKEDDEEKFDSDRYR